MEMKGAKAQERDVRTSRLSYKYLTLIQVRLGIKDVNGLVANRTFNSVNKRCHIFIIFIKLGLTVSEKS